MKPGHYILIVLVLVIGVGVSCFFWGKSIKICPELPIIINPQIDPGRDQRIDSLEKVIILRSHQYDSLKRILYRPHETIVDKPVPVPELVGELSDYYGW